MTLLIVQHVAGNTLGHLEEVLMERGLTFDYASAQTLTEAQVEATDFSGLILLGGPDSVTQDEQHSYMKREQQMVRNAIARNVPVFGICLGAQMLARSLGAAVERNRLHGEETKEIGWFPLELSEAGKADPVISKLADFPQFQWHEDRYHLPADAIHLAKSSICPEQAFRLKEKANVYGVQFHPEVTPAVIADWLRVSKTLPEPERQKIQLETDHHYLARHRASRKMFETYCELAYR